MIDGVLVVVAGALALWMTDIFRRLAITRALFDIPNERSSHKHATPRGGGIAIVLAFLFVAGLLWIMGRMPSPAFASLAIGGATIAAIGFMDDFRDLNAVVRIVVHFAAALWALAWLGGFPTVTVGTAEIESGVAGYAIGALLLVWLLNLYNFMDGIDGIAAIEAVSVAGSAALLLAISGEGPMALWLACLASAVAGFLVWNWPPARIFMGDVGSGFLGYTLGVLALITALAGALSIWTWVILLGVFLTDASMTLLRRMLRGDRWYAAHRSHAYQHASRRWRSHRTVMLGVLALNLLWLFPLAALSEAMPQMAVWLTILALIPLAGIAMVLGAGKVEDSVQDAMP